LIRIKDAQVADWVSCQVEGAIMPHAIAFLPVGELRTQLGELLERRAAIDDEIAEINECLREIEPERAERALPPAKWWYPA
jgi:hypothetical protein